MNFDLHKTYQYLLVCLAFLLPLTVAGSNLIIVSIVLIWLLSGNYKFKIETIMNCKILIFSMVFFSIHVIGLIWTEDINWGLHIVKKMWYFFLLFPVLHSIADKKYVKYYVSSFLLAISITELLSYLVWFEVIEPFKNATVENPTPFMSHISYNPILAFAIYLVSHKVLFEKHLSKLQLFFYSFFLISMTVNMFITGGRAGQVMFFAMIAIIILQYYKNKKIKAFIVTMLVLPTVFFVAYETSSLFNSRVNIALDNFINYSVNKDTSVGQRIAFALNSWEIIKENPIFGVGTGDFPYEYRKINQLNTPELPLSTNPHNMYTLVMVQLGLLGLASMLSIFYMQIKIAINASSNFYRDVGITLPILFLIIMLSDSYLLGHYTTLLFIFFSSFLYKKFE